VTIAVCIPARDEATTVGAVVRAVAGLRADGRVDDVLVIDDGSADSTARLAADAGARVISNVAGPGKGQALARAVASSDAEILVFLDADVTNVGPHYVTALLAPLAADPEVQLVKARYRRPLHGRSDEGGRVTELLARPLLAKFFPELATVAQPLAGECAIRRRALEGVTLADGYRIEIGLLIDVYRRFGRAAIAEADLGERVHRNHPLLGLRPHARDVLDAVVARI
jgi:glucosyl-3-phosphoglycerate synthase